MNRTEELMEGEPDETLRKHFNKISNGHKSPKNVDDLLENLLKCHSEHIAAVERVGRRHTNYWEI